MQRKRAVKRLMAMGVQRNDAAAFVTTYHKIVAAGKGPLLPSILKPTYPKIPTVCTDYQVRKFATIIRCSDKYDFRRVPRRDEDIYKELAREMGLALLDAGAVSITKRPLDCFEGGPGVEYRATINVAREATP